MGSLKKILYSAVLDLLNFKVISVATTYPA